MRKNVNKTAYCYLPLTTLPLTYGDPADINSIGLNLIKGKSVYPIKEYNYLKKRGSGKRGLPYYLNLLRSIPLRRV